jgi:hypothetical protein
VVPYVAGKLTGFDEGWTAARTLVAQIYDELMDERDRCATDSDESIRLYRKAAAVHDLVWRRLLEGREAAVEAYRATQPTGRAAKTGVAVNNRREPILGQPPGYASKT